MNTKIVEISEDQNTITNESGVVTVFCKNGACEECCYMSSRNCPEAPCHPYITLSPRNDFEYGCFKVKENEYTI